DLANQIMEKDRRASLEEVLARQTAQLVAEAGAKVAAPPVQPVAPAKVRRDHDIPQPPDLKLHVVRDYDLDEIFSYVNPVMLYTRHLGFKGKFDEAVEQRQPKALELRAQVQAVEEEMLRRPDITANAV